MYQSCLIHFLLMRLFYCFFFFLVTRNNNLFTPALIVNIKVKEEPVTVTVIPITVACEAILNVPNEADKAINILSR